MIEDTMTVDGVPMQVHSVNTLVIGSGAAGLNAAVALHDHGQENVAVITESWSGGASARAGSDTQTYCRLSLAGGAADSPRLLAGDLFAGGSMHGDVALCEAMHSVQAFYRLVQLGVPFPHDRYGGFPGCRTDHDPRGRGASAGPRTSQQVVEALSREMDVRGIPLFEPWQVVALLTAEEGRAARMIGAMALHLGSCTLGAPRFALFNAPNVVFGTGGPGGMYLDSAYPAGQTGSIGLALRAGAVAQNLTESQFGIASTRVRCNVSGSCQQVVPRYVSTDADGGDEREFLNDEFPDLGTLATAVFRKGDQWPFDPRLVQDHGSSLIDMLVHRERVERGRRVFLDFTRNPGGGPRPGGFSLDLLHGEAREYLRKRGATGASPVDRLAQMDPPALDVYRARGLDLRRDLLEIAVCARHDNGGLTGNIWWESNLAGLFPVGEVNGSHGVRRPRGASLNAGQVGGLRAAMCISRTRRAVPPPVASFAAMAGRAASEVLAFSREVCITPAARRRDSADVRREIQQRTSRAGAHVRRLDLTRAAAREAWAMCRELDRCSWAADSSDLPAVFRNRDLCLAHAVYLSAISEYMERGGQSRGSFVVLDDSGQFTLNAPDAFVDTHILEMTVDRDLTAHAAWVPIRPIPDQDAWSETALKAHRDGTVFD